MAIHYMNQCFCCRSDSSSLKSYRVSSVTQSHSENAAFAESAKNFGISNRDLFIYRKQYHVIDFDGRSQSKEQKTNYWALPICDWQAHGSTPRATLLAQMAVRAGTALLDVL